MLYTSYLCHELGVPFGTSNFKHIFWESAAASGLYSGVSSLLGGLLSSSSASSTNETNYQIAQMNNEYNSEQLQKLIDYNWDMWNADNEYNSASSQVQRYLDAGLNPAIMMTNGGNAGTATSMTAPSAAPADTSGTQKPIDYSFIGDAVANGVNSYNQANVSNSQAELLKEQASAQRIENEYKVENILAGLKQMETHTKYEQSKKDYQDLINNIQRATAASDIEYAQKRNADIDAQIMLTQAQTNVAIVQAELGYKELSYFDKSKQYEFAMTVANIQLAYFNGKLSLAQAKKAVAETYLAECQAANVNADTKLKEQEHVNMQTANKLSEALLEGKTMENEIYKLENARFSPSNEFDEFLHRGFNTANYYLDKANPFKIYFGFSPK